MTLVYILVSLLLLFGPFPITFMTGLVGIDPFSKVADPWVDRWKACAAAAGSPWGGTKHFPLTTDLAGQWTTTVTLLAHTHTHTVSCIGQWLLKTS